MADSIHLLTDEGVLERMAALVSRERENTFKVLTGLTVVETRQLHLKLGYGSMFDYCTKALNYSSSAAWRRIQAARCMSRFPVVREMLERKELSPSTVAQVSRVINESNCEHLLTRIRGKSQREVEGILTEYQPPERLVDRVRTVVMRVPATPSQTEAAPGMALLPPAGATPGACENSVYCRNGSEPVENAGPAADPLQTRVMLRFTISPELMDKLERVRALAWHRLPVNATLEQILEFLIEETLDELDPERRHVRRELRRRGAASVSAQFVAPGDRYVPAAVRDEVFARDGGKCTFVGANGHRCGSTLALQLDHIVPVALGGTSTPDNLRLLCAKHNRLEAERLLGPGVPIVS